MRSSLITVALTATLVAASTREASAGSVRCWVSPGAWNAPKGAAVVMHTPGVVAQTFAATGHHWTHVMLSHGPDAMSHATRARPQTNTDADAIFGRPLRTNNDRLPNGNYKSSVGSGDPGPSRLNMGGTYASIYGECGPAGRFGLDCNDSPDEPLVYYAGGDSRVGVVADAISSFRRAGVRDSSFAPTAGLEQYLLPRTFWFLPAGFPLPEMPVPYSFFQFKDIGTNHLGTISPDGIACSPFLAYAFNRATSAVIQPEVLPEYVVAAGLRAAHDATRDLCLDGFRDDWGLDTLARLGNACDKAGNQIADCFAGTNNGKCDNFGDEYTDPNKWGGGRTARVLSPDALVTHADSPWTPTRYRIAAGLLMPGSRSPDVWKTRGAPAQVQWSSEGGVYGCWVSDDHF